MASGDWSGTLNGLAFGGTTTAYDLQALTGWNDMSAAPLGGAGQLSPKQTRNGVWPVPEFMGTRTVTMVLQITAVSGAFETAIDALAAATQPGIGEVPLSLQINGVSTTVVGTVTGRIIPTTLDYLAGYTAAQITVECSDPRRLATPSTYTTQLPSSSGGLTWPITWPLVWASTQVSGQIVVTNLGNTSGPLSFTIFGPVTAPSIAQAETGVMLAFAPGFTVASGDFLAIDCESRTVLYNGQSSRSGYVSSRGWPTFATGDNTYSFNAAAGSGSLSIRATPAWI